jgi:hypothetical protein
MSSLLTEGKIAYMKCLKNLSFPIFGEKIDWWDINILGHRGPERDTVLGCVFKLLCRYKSGSYIFIMFNISVKKLQ